LLLPVRRGESGSFASAVISVAAVLVLSVDVCLAVWFERLWLIVRCVYVCVSSFPWLPALLYM